MRYTSGMNVREYTRLKLEAEAEYRRKLEAIETVWKLSGGANQGTATHGTSSLSKGSLHQAVKNAIQFLSGDFSLHDVEKRIQESDPALAARVKRPSLSSALKRLADDKEIVLVTTGSGKRASTYRRAG
jgi:hypothetical protein